MATFELNTRNAQIMASNNHMLIATRGASLVTTAVSSSMSGDGSIGGQALPTVCYDADPTEVVGLITLEDIIEEVQLLCMQHVRYRLALYWCVHKEHASPCSR